MAVFSCKKAGTAPLVQWKGIDMIIARNYYIIVKKRQAKKFVWIRLFKKIGIDLLEIQYIKIRNCDHPVCCPACDLRMIVKDSKRRYIKDESGRKLPFNLRRFYCPNCDRIHTEIPDLVTPYCQYDNATRERVKSGEYATFAGDDSTIRKWRKK